jgi:hypothetical protein
MNMNDLPIELSTQEQVLLGTFDEPTLHVGTARELADALTVAQTYLPADERISTPISAATVGQYLGMLRARGLVTCDPPTGVIGRLRKWQPS